MIMIRKLQALKPCCSCRRPRGFGFVEFMDERDAEDAMYGLDGKNFGGREISVCPQVSGLAALDMTVVAE